MVSVMLYPCIVCVSLYMVKQFAICLGVFVIFRQQVSARIRDMVRTDEMETRYTVFSNILIEPGEPIRGLYRQNDAEIQRECHKAKKKFYHSNVILLSN